MDHCPVLLLSPDGPLRAGLERTLTDLGHRVTGSPSPWAHRPPREGDVVVLDLRGPAEAWRRMAAALQRDERPLLVVSDRPLRLVRMLSGRPAGMVLLTEPESEHGYRVAMRLCEALSHRRAPEAAAAAS